MISVVLATYNEEKNLKRCLSAVKDWADEIIIVDGSSSDNTVKIAKQLGAKVFSTTNKPNFHINKQMAMDKAKGNLVLQLDADEVADQQLADFIKQTDQKLSKFKQSPEEPVAWWIKRKNLFLGKFLTKGGQYPDPVIRLYINGKARLPQKDVHEQMIADGKAGWADGHLIHYGNPTFDDYLKKFDTYTSLKATQLKTGELGEKADLSFGSGVKYLLIKPFVTWFLLFFRHKGFVDGIPGFVFAFFSGLHHAVAYLKLWGTKHD